MNQSLHDSLQVAFDELTSFLLDNVAENEMWEDAFPELDDIRAAIGDLLSKPNDDPRGLFGFALIQPKRTK